MLTHLLSTPVIALLWLLHFLPLSVLSPCGRILGMLLFSFMRKRRRVAAINFAWCFPELSEKERQQLLRRHFQALGRSLLERSLLWWSSRERLFRLIRVEGENIIHKLRDEGRPIILLAPHFVGLDAGGVAIALRFDVVSMYAIQSNPLIDKLLLYGRKRFGDQMLLTRQDGARASIRAMKSGRPFYYLPDISAHRRDSVFVPFFGIPTATITGLSRLSQAANAAVVPCVTRMLSDGLGYQLEIGEAWENYPTKDVESDTARMNQWLEGVIRTMPEQYYWVHRRFKTRPEGEPNPY